MKKLILLNFLVLIVACGTKKQTPEKTTPIDTTMYEANSRNSLDWGGIYTGTLPCADCEGISVTIILNGANNTYQMESSYMGKKTNQFTENDTLKWSKDGNKILLLSGQKFRVMENKLELLDADGKRIETEFGELYVLNKMIDDAPETKILKGNKYKISKIKGKDYSQEDINLYFLEFIDQERFTAKAGCNNMMGTYSQDEEGNIQFGKILSTKKLCQFPNGEDNLINSFQIINSYEFKNRGDMLFLKLNQGEVLIELKKVNH